MLGTSVALCALFIIWYEYHALKGMISSNDRSFFAFIFVGFPLLGAIYLIYIAYFFTMRLQINGHYANKFIYAKIIIQILGAGLGFYGLFYCEVSLIGINVLYLHRDLSGQFSNLFNSMMVIVFIIGLYYIITAYRLVMKFSKNGIKHFFICFSIIIAMDMPHKINKMYHFAPLTEAKIFPLYIISAIIFYIVTSKLLLKWYDSSTPQAAAPD